MRSAMSRGLATGELMAGRIAPLLRLGSPRRSAAHNAVRAASFAVTRGNHGCRGACGGVSLSTLRAMSTPSEPTDALPESLTGQSKDETLRMFREMLRIRRFEETAARAYTRGKISGFLHLYIGQEAIAVGVS